MRTRFAVATVAVMLTVAPACRNAKDNNLPGAIKNVPSMVENARDVMADPAPQAQKVVPKPDVAETHQAEVLKTTPQPTKAGSAPKLERMVPKKEPLSGIEEESPKFRDKIDVQMSH